MSANQTMLFCLRSIMNSLPQNKDWLSPDVERLAREAIAVPETDEPKLTWQKSTAHQYTAGAEHLYLGRWRVGGTFYNACRDKDDQNVWGAACRLPGLKDVLWHFVTREEAKAKVEKAVKHWMKHTNDALNTELNK
jgi:hypothetical protein